MNKLEKKHKVVYDNKATSTRGNSLESHAAITKEVAIGFRNWCDDTVGHSFIHEGPRSIYFGKSYDKLFEMYLNTLK